MLKTLKALDRVVMGVLKTVVITANIAITLLVLFLVLARFVLGWSVVGVLEMATIAAVWLYMCGAMIATHNREHLVVDFLSQSIVHNRVKAAHDLAVYVIVLVLALFFLKLSLDMLEWYVRRPQTTAALSLPLIIPQSAIIVAAVLSVVYALRDIVLAAIVLLRGPQLLEEGE